MKKLVNGVLEDVTAEEIAQREIDNENFEAERQALITARETKANLKASAKAKLMNGEALTEEEANTIVL